MNKVLFLRLWSAAAGAMDALTGMALIFAPAGVLGLLRIPGVSPDAMVFASWIGVFVMSVGLSYSLAVFGKRSKGEAAWMFTSLVRMAVAVFLTVKVVAGSMAEAWLLVAASDASVALVQIVLLRRGWWKEVPR